MRNNASSIIAPHAGCELGQGGAVLPYLGESATRCSDGARLREQLLDLILSYRPWKVAEVDTPRAIFSSGRLLRLHLFRLHLLCCRLVLRAVLTLRLLLLLCLFLLRLRCLGGSLLRRGGSRGGLLLLLLRLLCSFIAVFNLRATRNICTLDVIC